MPLTAAERASMIERYARGPALLAAALAKVPRDALQWRPGPKRWSAHEIIVHCADSETNGHGRLRFLLAEPKPVIQGYDQDRWSSYSTTIRFPSSRRWRRSGRCAPTTCRF